MMEYGDFLADFSKRTLVNLRALKKNKFKVTAEIVGLIALLAMYREYDEIIERQHRPRHAEFLAKLKGLLADDKPKPPSDARLMMQGLKHALVHFDFRPVHADGKVRGIVFSNRKNRNSPPKWQARIEDAKLNIAVGELTDLFDHVRKCQDCTPARVGGGARRARRV